MAYRHQEADWLDAGSAYGRSEGAREEEEENQVIFFFSGLC